MTAGVSDALQRALADATSAPRARTTEAHVAELLHARVRAAVARICAQAGVEAVLVKGAALAITVYAEPAARPMTDLDLLVREEDRDRVVAALVAAGCTEHDAPGRVHSGPLLGETVLAMHAGALRELVEVHTSLDKIVPRPVDVRAIFDRSSLAPGLPGLRVPAAEDHALLVALHAAGHGFAHPIAFLDLELLLRRGLDTRVLVERARAWQLSSVMFAMLTAMRDLGAASVSDDLVAAFDPGPLRRELLRRARAWAAHEPGLAWIVAQTPLRDDFGAWLTGLGRYAVARVRDRVEPLAQVSRGVQDRGVPYRVPVWVRAMLALDVVAARLENLREGLRDEMFLAWVPPADRAALTASLYSVQSTYLPDGHRFKSGLFAWERQVLDAPAFPRAGRVLIGAAGAGREMVAMLERGFDVVAFDPCKPFADAAASVARSHGKGVVVHASYRDLVDAARGHGPLASACAAGPFDAVVLGWGSLSHVMPASERKDLLLAVRALAPRAPVLASFALEPERALPVPGKGRVRDSLRRAFSALGAPGASEDGDHFLPNTGFFSYLGSDEVVRLAWETGYEVALFEESPYAHALLVPLGRSAVS